RGVADTRQLYLPGVVLLGPARREALHLAEPRTVGPPEARPVLGRGRREAARPRDERSRQPHDQLLFLLSPSRPPGRIVGEVLTVVHPLLWVDRNNTDDTGTTE